MTAAARIESAAEVLAEHSHVYDSDCGEDYGCAACPSIGEDEDIYLHQAQMLAAAGLLS